MTELYTRYPALLGCKKDIEAASALLLECAQNGGKILLCGNGGSCADADHIAGELLKSFVLRREPTKEEKEKIRAACPENAEFLIDNLQRGIPAVSLPSLCAVNTAYINDAEPSMVYGQLVYALGRPGDVVLGLSTSGNSKNVVYAMQVAKAMGLKTIALTGAKESKLSDLCTCTVKVPETETYKVQELHLPVYHHLCLELEETLFGE